MERKENERKEMIRKWNWNEKKRKKKKRKKKKKKREEKLRHGKVNQVYSTFQQ